MMSDAEYDLVVIGSGPGGEGAAMQAAKEGKSVAVIEKYDQIGGGCTHWGTIPSKALRFSIYQMTEANENPLFQQSGVHIKLTFEQLRRGARSVIEKQVTMRNGFYERNNVPIYYGHGAFRDDHSLDVVDTNGKRKTLAFQGAVVATGSRPWHPSNIDFDHPRIHDSNSILNLQETPRSITIYGAGVIGCEYASLFGNLRCKVNLVNTRDSLLDFLDDEITDALSYHMRDNGIRIRHREVMERIEGLADGVVLHLKSGKKVKSDVLLFALGRSGNSDNLGLERIQLEPNKRGQLEINEHFQTAHDHIYAVGDIIGFPSLASAAYVQGRYAAQHWVHGTADKSLIDLIPTGIYTSPEISSVGQTEQELTEANIPYEVGTSLFKHLARSQILGRDVGLLKILFHRETLEVLGIHCFGASASEIIHIGQAIMAQNNDANTLNYFANATFNYPTMAEAYRVASLNGLNRLF